MCVKIRENIFPDVDPISCGIGIVRPNWLLFYLLTGANSFQPRRVQGRKWDFFLFTNFLGFDFVVDYFQRN